MSELNERFKVLDRLEPTALEREIARRSSLPESGPAPLRPRTRLAAGLVAASIAAIAVFAWSALRPLGEDARDTAQTPASDAWSWAGEGWTELPAPPVWREGAALLWTGRSLLLWGGCETPPNTCEPTADGYVFDPATRSWDTLPDAPFTATAATGTIATWTGELAVFFVGDRVAAYDPSARTWRELAGAPLQPQTAVWTGNQIIAVEPADLQRETPPVVAAFDPAADRWEVLPSPPQTFTNAVATWSGTELLLLAGHLTEGRHALTPTPFPMALDPSTRTWRSQPPSALLPQSFDAEWIGDRLVAWDYNLKSQVLDPRRGVWTSPVSVPVDGHECYVDGARVASVVLAWYCGDAALTDGHDWEPVMGGPLDDTVYSAAYEREIDIWRFADLVTANDVVVAFLEGITLDDKGIACYGCPGSPTSYWVYRPEMRTSTEVPSALVAP